MKEIQLVEVMPRLNTRGVMGRVVVPNETLERVSPRVTGKIIMCCNRAYLTKESYERHKNSGDCGKVITIGGSDRRAGTSIGSRDSRCFSDEGHFDDEDEEMPIDVGSMVKCLLKEEPQIQMNSPMRYGYYNGASSPLTTTPTKEHLTSDRSTWALAKRKISFLERDVDPPKPNFDEVEVMSHFKTIKSESGGFVFSCRRCSFSSDKTNQITDHIKTVHPNLLSSNRKHPPNGRIKVEQGIVKTEGAVSINDDQWLTCTLCNVFKTRHKHSIAVHEKVAHVEASKGFPCRFCSCVYSTKGKTSMHERTFHASMMKMNCEKDRIARSRITAKRIQCGLCPLTFSSNQNVAKHKRSSHVSGGRFPCPSCPCVFAIEATRTLHKNKYHKNKPGSRTTSHLPSKTSFLSNWLKQGSNGVGNEEERKATDLAGVPSISEENLKYKCAICRKLFTSKALLILHQRKRHLLNTSYGSGGANNVKNRNRCLICVRAFSSPGELADHKASSHVEGGSYPCPVKSCKCIFGKQRSLTAHLIWHKKNRSKGKMETKSVEVKVKSLPRAEPFTCALCGMKLRSETEIDLHLKTSHVICGVICECGCSFGTATELTHHKLRECPKILKELTLTMTNRVNQSSALLLSASPKRRSPTTCRCGIVFQSRHELLDHMQEKNCKPEEIMQKEMSDNSEKAAEITMPEVESVPQKEVEYVPCPHCSMKFKSSAGLRVHVLYIHGKKEPVKGAFAKCEICNYNTKHFGTYTYHKKTCHVEGGFKCSECCCTFKTVDGVSRHFTLMHQDKTFNRALYELTCGECEFTTFNKMDLKWHQQRVHSEKIEKEDLIHSCELCNFKTRCGRWELTRHMEKSHAENGWKCKYCCCSLLTETGLRHHIKRLHSEECGNETESYDCDKCDYSTSSRKNYLDHIEFKHVENGFQCEFCSCSFATENGLRKHTYLLHTKNNEDYSSCKLCDYPTGNPRNYKEHMKRCHVENGAKCPECPCTFKEGSGLYKHVLIRHKRKINLKDFEKRCRSCAFVTYTQFALEQHEIEHTKPSKNLDTNDISKEYPVCDLCGCNVKFIPMEEHIKKSHVEGGSACPQCPCSFRNEIALVRHLRQRHGIRRERSVKDLDPSIYVFPCTRCSFRSKSQQGLNIHSLQMHGVKIPITRKVKTGHKPVCSICNLSYSGTAAAHNKRYHVENGFKCAHCPCTFETYGSRLRHSMKVHKSFVSKRCDLCGLKFTGSVKYHVEKCHVQDGIKCSFCCCTFQSDHAKRGHELHVHKNSQSRSKSMQCNLCGMRLKESMNHHLRRCHVKDGLRCGFCVCTFVSEASRLIHMSRQHGFKTISGPRKCKLCPGVFKMLRSHMKRCHVPGGVKCDYCSCTFGNELGKMNHMQKKHKEELPVTPSSKVCNLCGIKVTGMSHHMKVSHVPGGVKCDYCNCTFAFERGKFYHMQKRHKKDLPAISKNCHLCGMKVTLMELHLKKSHVRNGIKCDYCVCTLANKRAKKIHMLRRHKEQMPAAPKVCHLCGIKVKSLQDHLEYNHVENGIPCSHCACTLRSEVSKSRHIKKYHKDDKRIIANDRNMRINSDSKKCALCGMKLNGTLAEHMRSHHASSGYQCSYCNCKLKTQDARRIHIFKVHKDKSQLESSQQIYSNPNNTCKLCGIETDERLEDHIRRCHCISNPFTCSHCNCRFLTKISLTRHFLSQHKDAMKKGPVASPAKGSPKVNNSISPTKINSRSPVKSKSPRKDSLKKPSSPGAVTRPTFQCPNCPSKFPSEKGLRIHHKLSHSRRISTDDVDSVSECSSSASTSISRNKPSQKSTSMDTNDKKETSPPSKQQLTCLQCGYVASCISLLNIHMQKSHVKNSLYPCPRCSCAFANDPELTRHLKIFHPDPIFIVKE